MSCCGRKFIITEDERKHILSLYGLITEDEPKPQSNTSSLKFDKTINFAPGYYRTKGPVTTKAGTTYNWDVDQTLKSDLEKVKEFLKKNPTGYIVEVNLYSGESQIPNNDNEQGGVKVKPGDLNTSRLNSLKTYIDPIFQSWKQEGITQTDFKINEYKNIGKTAWVGTPFCPANTTDPRTCSTTYYNKVIAKDPTALEYKTKYDAEQYFRVIIEVKKVETPETPKTTPPTDEKPSTTNVNENCATGLRIRVDVEKHNCNNAEFFVFLNNTMLYNVDGGYTANGNNSNSFVWSDSGKKIRAKRLNPGYGRLGTAKYGVFGDLMGVRYDEFIVTPEQSKEIVEKSEDGKINVWYLCTLATGCHLDTPTVRIYKDDLPIYEGQPMSDNTLLITLDACGNKVLEIDKNAIEPDASAMREKIQTDRMSMVIDNEKDVPDKEDTKQMELKASNTLITMMNYIETLFTHPTIRKIFFQRIKGKTPKVYQKEYEIGGKAVYENYNIAENKELFTWFATKIDDPTLTLYLQEISKVIIQNKYQMLNGAFVDKTIRESDMHEDIRTNLESFYVDFNKLFTIGTDSTISFRFLDEETYPYNYVRFLDNVRNPGVVYEKSGLPTIQS
jgi:hypothetical protein